MNRNEAKAMLYEVFYPKQLFSAVTNNKIAFNMHNFHSACEEAAAEIEARTCLPLKGKVDSKTEGIERGCRGEIS